MKRASRWEILGAWLHIWTPGRDVYVPPVPWGKVALGAAGLVVIGVAIAIFVAPEIDEDKRTSAARQQQEERRARDARNARIRREQQPRFGDLPADAVRSEQLRAVAVAIGADARERFSENAKTATCEPVPGRDPDAGRVMYDCHSKVRDIIGAGEQDGAIGQLAIPYRANVHYAKDRYAFCRVHPQPGEQAILDPRDAVLLPKVCSVYRGDDAVEGSLEKDAVRSRGPQAKVTGRVEPASATVRIRDPEGRRLARGNVAADGGFTAVLPDVPAGTTEFELAATAEGVRPWKAEIEVRRGEARPAAEIVIPERDTTPPEAWLVLRSGGMTISSVAPVRDDTEAPIELRDRRVDLEATIRDADGGTGRIRASLTYEQVCPGRAKRLRTHHFPPSEIANVRIPHGRRVPVERRRTGTVRVDPGGPGCVARGLAWADATSANGLESFSDQIAFVVG